MPGPQKASKQAPEKTSTTPPSTPKASKPRLASRKRRKWLVRGAVITVAGAVVYTLGGFYGVPAITRWMIESKVTERINGQATLVEATFNPYTFRFTLTGLVIADATDGLVVGVESFDTNFSFWGTLFKPGIRFESMAIAVPELQLARTETGSINLLDLFPPTQKTQSSSSKKSEPLRTIPRLVVNNLSVRDARFGLQDRAIKEPFEANITKMDATVTGMDLAPDNGNPLAITLTTDRGESITVSASLFANPLTIEGEVLIEGLDLTRYQPYVNTMSPAVVTSGELEVDLTFRFAPVDDNAPAQATLLTTKISNFNIDHAGQSVFALDHVELTDLSADGGNRSLALGGGTVSGLRAKASRLENGQLSVMDLVHESIQQSLASAGSAGNDQTSDPNADDTVDVSSIEYPLVQLAAALEKLRQEFLGPWSFSAQPLVLENIDFAAQDQAVQPAASLVLSGLSGSLGPITSQNGFNTPFDLNWLINETGQVSAQGELNPTQGSLQTTVEAKDLPIAFVAGYVPEQLGPFKQAKLKDAQASVKGTLTGNWLGDDGLQVAWDGTTSIRYFLLTDKTNDDVKLAIDHLETKGKASGGLDSKNNLRAQWDGRLSLLGMNFDAPLTTGAALTNLVFPQLIINGQTTLTPPTQTTGPSVTWEGELALKDLYVSTDLLSATQPKTDQTPASPTTASSQAIDIKGQLQAGIDSEGTSQLTWTGQTTLTGLTLRTDTPQAKANGSIGQIEITSPQDGTRVQQQAAGDQAVAFNGQITLQNTDLDATLPQIDSHIKLKNLVIQADTQADLKPVKTSNASEAQPAPAVAAAFKGNMVLSGLDGQSRFTDTKLVGTKLSETIPSIQLDDITWSFNDQELLVDRVLVQSPDIKLETTIVAQRSDKDAAPKNDKPDKSSEQNKKPAKPTVADAASKKQALRDQIGYGLVINHLEVEQGQVNIFDTGMEPAAPLTATDLAVDVRNVNVQSTNPLDLLVTANLAGSGQLKTEAKIKPFGISPEAAGTIRIQSLGLKPYSPWIEYFLGYEVDRGQYSMQTPFALNAEQQIDIDADFRLDDFYVGDKVKSPVAPNLPVPLGLDILRDRQGDIASNLPITGNLSDPSLRLEGIILTAIGNLIEKAVAAPFDLIAGAFGGEQDVDYSMISLPAGQTEPSLAEAEKLKLVADFLASRPAINVVLISVADPVLDRQAIQAERQAAYEAALAEHQAECERILAETRAQPPADPSTADPATAPLSTNSQTQKAPMAPGEQKDPSPQAAQASAPPVAPGTSATPPPSSDPKAKATDTLENKPAPQAEQPQTLGTRSVRIGRGARGFRRTTAATPIEKQAPVVKASEIESAEAQPQTPAAEPTPAQPIPAPDSSDPKTGSTNPSEPTPSAPATTVDAAEAEPTEPAIQVELPPAPPKPLPVTDEELAALARARGEWVARHLIEQRGVPAERIEFKQQAVETPSPSVHFKLD